MSFNVIDLSHLSVPYVRCLVDAVTIEAPTVLSWGFFSSDSDSSRVFVRVLAETCGLGLLSRRPGRGHIPLSPCHSSLRSHSPPKARSPQKHQPTPLQINGLRADCSNGSIAALLAEVSFSYRCRRPGVIIREAAMSTHAGKCWRKKTCAQCSRMFGHQGRSAKLANGIA